MKNTVLYRLQLIWKLKNIISSFAYYLDRYLEHAPKKIRQGAYQAPYSISSAYNSTFFSR